MSRYRRKSGWFGRRKSRNYREGNGSSSILSSIWASITGLSSETQKGIFIILLFVVGALCVMGLLDLSGKFGQFTNYILSIGFGSVKWLVPVLLGAWVFFLLNEEKYPIRLINYFGTFLFLLGLAGLFHLPYDSWQSLVAAKAGQGGGYLGVAAALPLLRLMNFWGAMVILIASLMIGLLLALETSIYGIMWPFKLAAWLGAKFKEWYAYRKLKKQERLLAEQNNENNYEEEPISRESVEVADEEEITDDDDAPGFVKTEVKMGYNDAESADEITKKTKKYGPIDIPVSLLNSTVGKPTSGDIKNNAEIIRKTLNNFGIAVEMGDINIGPTVTQFTMRPTDGVRLARITTLNADLALALAAHPIRIEAPIPGKALVGIEVPNVQSAKVTMGEMLLSKEYKNRTTNLDIALGKDVSGKSIFAQLDKMPHLLVAGATGSGKSVCINSIIVSLMYQNSPDELKFILVDPKRVELQMYNSIPYLLAPVITDVKKTVGALKWAIVEMERRFELLAKFGNRNIASFNSTHSDKIPYIVIIIDELADLMATNGNDMEAGIVRLAQMARAVGIHLILATQRPSTEVITGLIKANIPARMAFTVASSIDSRTILDGAGAEKLVGRGDMLYLGPEMSKPKRLQGVFLSDKEINAVVKFIKSRGEVDYDDKLFSVSGGIGGSSFGGGFGSGDDDPVMNEAIEVIKDAGRASASLLQRRLKLGYARAARILDMLEEKGMIGPSDGAKPREVFLDAMGGGGVMQFAAKEHGLTGELRPLVDSEVDEWHDKEIEDEPGFTAFSRFEEPEVIMPDARAELIKDEDYHNEDESIPSERKEEIVDENDLIDTDEIIAEEEQADAETFADIEEIEAEEEKVVPVKPAKGGKNYFSDDEWT